MRRYLGPIRWVSDQPLNEGVRAQARQLLGEIAGLQDLAGVDNFRRRVRTPDGVIYDMVKASVDSPPTVRIFIPVLTREQVRFAGRIVFVPFQSDELGNFGGVVKEDPFLILDYDEEGEFTAGYFDFREGYRYAVNEGDFRLDSDPYNFAEDEFRYGNLDWQDGAGEVLSWMGGPDRYHAPTHYTFSATHYGTHAAPSASQTYAEAQPARKFEDSRKNLTSGAPAAAIEDFFLYDPDNEKFESNVLIPGFYEATFTQARFSPEVYYQGRLLLDYLEETDPSVFKARDVLGAAFVVEGNSRYLVVCAIDDFPVVDGIATGALFFARGLMGTDTEGVPVVGPMERFGSVDYVFNWDNAIPYPSPTSPTPAGMFTPVLFAANGLKAVHTVLDDIDTINGIPTPNPNGVFPRRRVYSITLGETWSVSHEDGAEAVGYNYRQARGQSQTSNPDARRYETETPPLSGWVVNGRQLFNTTDAYDTVSRFEFYDFAGNQLVTGVYERVLTRAAASSTKQTDADDDVAKPDGALHSEQSTGAETDIHRLYLRGVKVWERSTQFTENYVLDGRWVNTTDPVLEFSYWATADVSYAGSLERIGNGSFAPPVACVHHVDLRSSVSIMTYSVCKTSVTEKLRSIAQVENPGMGLDEWFIDTMVTPPPQLEIETSIFRGTARLATWQHNYTARSDAAFRADHTGTNDDLGATEKQWIGEYIGLGGYINSNISFVLGVGGFDPEGLPEVYEDDITGPTYDPEDDAGYNVGSSVVPEEMTGLLPAISGFALGGASPLRYDSFAASCVWDAESDTISYVLTVPCVGSYRFPGPPYVTNLPMDELGLTGPDPIPRQLGVV